MTPEIQNQGRDGNVRLTRKAKRIPKCGLWFKVCGEVSVGPVEAQREDGLGCVAHELEEW